MKYWSSPRANNWSDRDELASSLALQLLALHCMSTTLAELKAHRDRIRREIVERECVLAALDVLHNYAASAESPGSFDLGPLASMFLYPARELPVRPASLPAPAPPSLPPPSRPKPEMDPELEQLLKHNRTNVAIVRWAMQRVPEEFSLPDIRKALERQGYRLKGPEISVVLTRLKSRGEIEEIKRARGPIAAIFRKPVGGVQAEADAASARENMEVAVAPAVA